MDWDYIFGTTIDTRHKVFLSYYHKEDEYFRIRFQLLFGRMFINKSVKPGDIDSDVSTEYIKRLIQEGYLTDTSVLVVLVGPRTYTRKHVDWEISAGLSKKDGGDSGVVGFCLPTHPDYGRREYNPFIVPPRLADNIASGYAQFYDWTENKIEMKSRIEEVFRNRVQKTNLIDNSREQFEYNRTHAWI